MLVRAGDDGEEKIKDDERHAGGQPAAEKFPGDDLPARNRLGQQRKNGAGLALGGNLPGGGDDGDDERGDPDEQQARVLDDADDLVVVEKIHRPGGDREQRGEDEQDVKILAAVKFLDDDAGERENFIHGWGED